MPKLKVTLDDFDKALTRLNEKLNDRNLFISIKAIGGYAMLKYGLRLNGNENTGYSEDIDTVTEKYGDAITDLIKEVAEEQDLLPDWLNNEPFDLPEISNVINELNWISSDNNFSNIGLEVADIYSLLLLKVRAVDMGGLVPRKTDKNDLIKILKFIGIFNIDDLQKDDKTKFITQYKLCFKYLEEKGNW